MNKHIIARWEGALAHLDCGCACLSPNALKFCSSHAAAPALLETVAYFDYAYNWADDDGTLADDDIVELRVTGKALKDARAAIAQAKGEK